MFNIPNKNQTNQRYLVGLFLFCLYFISISAYSQCAMCRAALGGEENKVKAEAVNDGIVFLMVIPYLLVAGIAYAIYRLRKQQQK
jgi:hypothetical protein